jgi:hypothetical protein
MALDLNSLSIFAKSDSFPFFTFRSMTILTAMFSTSPFFWMIPSLLRDFKQKLKSPPAYRQAGNPPLLRDCVVMVGKGQRASFGSFRIAVL